jgi:hypothetical protein
MKVQVDALACSSEVAQHRAQCLESALGSFRAQRKRAGMLSQKRGADIARHRSRPNAAEEY